MLEPPFTIYELLESLLIIVVFIIAGKIITYFAQNYVKKWAEKTTSKIDDILVEKIKPPFSYVVWFIGLKIALNPLHLNYDIAEKIINTILLAIVIYTAMVVASVLVQGVIKKLAAKTESTMDDALMPLISKTISVVIFLIGLMWALSIWEIDVTPLLASIGVAGLAIGLAVKDSLANIFGGISMILDKTIKVGDKVKLESGEVGYINDIGLRSTKLRTFSNEIITIPNGQLANSRIQNFVYPSPPQRVQINFGVSYDTDVDSVRKIVHDVIMGMEGIDKEDRLPEVLFVEMGESALLFYARFWVADYEDEWKRKLEATDKIFRALRENNISIPYPTKTVHLIKD